MLVSRRTLLCTLLSSLLLGGAQAASAQTKTVRLLAVGNSFSQNATRYLPDIVKAAGHVLVHHPAAVGGATMALHWDKAELHEKGPQDPRGLYASKRSLKGELAAEKWDFITIQQASLRSHDVATYRPYARLLRDYLRKGAPQAKVMLHQTWAYRVDDPRFSVAKPAPGEPATQEVMYRGLKKAYETIADELGLGIIPVGDAFYRADTDTHWGYRPDRKFDLKRAQPPKLPDQTHSLHVGWRWSKSKSGEMKLTMDGHHANAAGEYLGACVFFEVMYGESPVGNRFVPAGVDPAHARFLQETAHRAVQDRGKR